MNHIICYACNKNYCPDYVPNKIHSRDIKMNISKTNMNIRQPKRYEDIIGYIDDVHYMPMYVKSSSGFMHMYSKVIISCHSISSSPTCRSNFFCTVISISPTCRSNFFAPVVLGFCPFVCQLYVGSDIGL